MAIISDRNEKSANTCLRQKGAAEIANDDERRAASFAWDAWDSAAGSNLITLLVAVVALIFSVNGGAGVWIALGFAVVAIGLQYVIYLFSRGRVMARAVVDHRGGREDNSPGE